MGPVPHDGQTKPMPRDFVGLEWESLEAWAVRFAPPVEDATPVGMNYEHFHLGEDDCAVEVGKWPQANESMGEGGHHVALHGRRGKRWGSGKGRVGNQTHWEAVCHLDNHSRSLRVQVSNGCIGHRINNTAGAGVSNASVEGWKVGGITSQRS